MSGKPHDDRRSEQHDPELDPDQHVEDTDQQRPENAEDQPRTESTENSSGAVSASSRWELDDDSDATIDLPAVKIPTEGSSSASSPEQGDASAHDESQDARQQDDDDATAVWENFLTGRAAAERDSNAPSDTDEDASAEADESTDPNDLDDVTAIAAPYEPDLVAAPTYEPDAAEPEPQAAAAAAPSGPVNAEGLPLRPRERGRRSAKPAKKSHTLLWAILAGVLVVLVAVALILYFALRDKDDDKITGGSTVESMPTSIQKGSPAAAVQDLGEAFKDGDAEAALDLLEVSSLQSGKDKHALLTNKVYTKAKNRPEAITPAKESYGVPASNALTAGVTATVKQGGKEEEVSMRLTRADADAPWKVATASLPALDVTDGGAAKVKVNSSDVTLPGAADDYSTHRLFVLPGDYTLKRTNTKFVSYPKAKSFKASGLALAADPDSKTTDLGTASLAGTLNDAFKKEADKSVTSWLDNCIASKELAPSSCPFGADAGGETVSDIKWTLDKEPTLSYPDLSVDNATVEGKDGQASVEAKVKKDGNDATLEADMEVDFSGTLTIKGNKVNFSYSG